VPVLKRERSKDGTSDGIPATREFLREKVRRVGDRMIRLCRND